MPIARLAAAVSVPWNAFIAAFLYYTLLTLASIGLAELPTLFVAISYLLPLALYAGVLIVRAVRALEALPVEIGYDQQLLLH